MQRILVVVSVRINTIRGNISGKYGRVVLLLYSCCIIFYGGCGHWHGCKCGWDVDIWELGYCSLAGNVLFHCITICCSHYPTTKFTQVVDAVQSESAKKSQNLASTVDYKSQYQAYLGQYTQTAETVSSRHAVSAQKQASGSSYRNESTQAHRTRDSESRYYRESEPEHRYYREPEPKPEPEPQRPPAQLPASEPRYVAIYDYTAADDDEVSFMDGDIIVNTEVIDEGWMTGTVQRTGETGMLPSNYVERM
jgi:hypothetical protein